MRLSSITSIRLKNGFRTLVLIPFALIARKWMPNVWIVNERPDQARDNGYCFFKYMKEQHPEQPVYYIIDFSANDVKKIKQYGCIINYGSLKHFFYFNLSKVHISAHNGGFAPGDNPVAKRIRKKLGINNIFLPHGVSYGIADFCLAKYGNIDLFITSGKPEYDNVLANYGYCKDQVVYTGFPRLDGWHHLTTNKKQIVLMPTWRLYLAQNPDLAFTETNYYKSYNELINDNRICDFLVNNGLTLVFYLHHNMRIYVNSFHTKCYNIKIAYKDEDYDIQSLLKESALLITDYSSVHFDFAYMEKPVLYYQFDKEEFWEKQYQQTDFDASKNGFGPVAYNLDQLMDYLEESYRTGFQLQGIYKERMNNFYLLHDEHNCERVYEEIVKRYM